MRNGSGTKNIVHIEVQRFSSASQGEKKKSQEEKLISSESFEQQPRNRHWEKRKDFNETIEMPFLLLT